MDTAVKGQEAIEAIRGLGLCNARGLRRRRCMPGGMASHARLAEDLDCRYRGLPKSPTGRPRQGSDGGDRRRSAGCRDGRDPQQALCPQTRGQVLPLPGSTHMTSLLRWSKSAGWAS
jgi:hypothetical protein